MWIQLLQEVLIAAATAVINYFVEQQSSLRWTLSKKQFKMLTHLNSLSKV